MYEEMMMMDQGNGAVAPPMGGPPGGVPQGPEAEVQELLMLRDQIDQRLAELGMPMGGPANDPMAGMAPPIDPAMAGGMPPTPGLLG